MGIGNQQLNNENVKIQYYVLHSSLLCAYICIVNYLVNKINNKQI
jgi:hypothetical protein